MEVKPRGRTAVLLLAAAMMLLVQPALGATSITINFGGATTVYPGDQIVTTVTFLSNNIATDPSSMSVVNQKPSGTSDLTTCFQKISTGVYRCTTVAGEELGQRTFYATGTIAGAYTTASASFSVACPALSATLTFDKSTYLLGDNVLTTVRYYKSGAPADPSSHTLTVLLPTGSTSTLTLTKSSTGVYTSTGVASSSVGQRTATATATISSCPAQATASYNVVSSMSTPTPTPAPAATAPKASLRLVSATTSSITIEHQGGDTLAFSDVSARIDGVPYSLQGLTGITLSVGQKMEIQFGFNVVKSGSTASLIHTPTSQTIASFLVYLSTPTPVSTPTPFTTGVGSPCALGVVVRSDKTQVERDGLARLTATVSNSGDETCTGTTLYASVIPSGGTATWDRTSVDVPAKSSADIQGRFSASVGGSYTVTVTATRGTVSANGAVTLGVSAPTPAPTPSRTSTPQPSTPTPAPAEVQRVEISANVSGLPKVTPGFEALPALAALGLLALILRARRQKE